ncbi:Polyphosphate kinase 2, PPK2 family [Marinobacter daqiaonensis]|uniref:Polyphosphate kinase 2, PPK2 family n=1 Tax=Marinobacter daqiaonensis TaxID=650891 RepID=A0A1I6JPU4_9GAMM|nr:polyphosphate kinase [Marinobacter daqiaonensis]SFR80974.1 Polyphosphate kinase 2, PPK2 family [Marinobacter daqiaonensis]
MVDTDDAKTWFFEPERRSLADYPCKVNDRQEVPPLKPSLKRIGEYQRRLWANGQKAVLLIVHGPDACGKDSLIRTLAAYMDPAGFRSWSFSRPTGLEAAHDFLWRVVPSLPALGELVAFNRSHHEAVMAEKLWPVREESHYDWPARYAAIRAFERHLVQEGTTIIKVWLNVSPEKHRHRLLKRLDKPRKRWKFDRSDVEGWERRHEYLSAVEEAIAATHTPEAPWLIIPDDKKKVARALIASILAEQLELLAPDYPPEDDEVLERYRKLLEVDT